jgi:hypothetical protein
MKVIYLFTVNHNVICPVFPTPAEKKVSWSASCRPVNTNVICDGFYIFFFPDVYDSGRRDKPSVLVTSPGSPELNIPHRSARPPRLGSSPTISNVGGRLQVSVTSNNSKNAFKK